MMGIIMRDLSGTLVEVATPKEAQDREDEGYIYHVPLCAVCREVVQTEPLLSGGPYFCGLHTYEDSTAPN